MMASKKDKKKTSTGTRNPIRKNGKAFKKKKFDHKGRALTGRGKPSGRSDRGERVPDFVKAATMRSIEFFQNRTKAA